MQAAHAQDAKPNVDANDLEEVVVTGSRIRRVDAETASPVLVIDKAAIEKSGVTTAGDLLSRLPTVSGAATNPAVNNGGGFGEANIELRGLDAKRTLVLLNGRRLGLVGTSDATDINLIPVNLLERVDVLKEGAGAIYGSDAIAGVVNFVTRKDVNGAELTGTYGESAESDGKYSNVNLLWGTSGDNFHFTFNGSYQKQKEVWAGDREFSKFALYLYSHSVQQGGSSRVPNGRINLPATTPGLDPALAGCGSVTRIEGAAGSTQADYRCYTGADAFNYQPFNLIMTPQERGSLFSTWDYEINDKVQMYAELLYNRTSSGFEIAPLPFDGNADDVVVSSQSMYNPFGIDFGGVSGANPNIRVRLSSLGDRRSNTSSDAKAVKLGVRGEIGDSGWNWDAMAGYSRLDQDARIYGYLLQHKLADAFGPSFLNSDPVPTPQCGTPADPIPLTSCTPVNIFNLADPAQISALGTITTSYHTDREFTSKQASLSADGKLFKMPAGDALVSIEADYLDQQASFNVDALTIAQPPLFLNCEIAQETCSGLSSGGYSVQELSAEVFLPLVADKTGIQALNVTLGSRFSDYEQFGNTTNSTFKLEYRPIKDILFRGTYAQVFRTPTILDLSASPTANSVTFSDTCQGLTPARLAGTPSLAAACVNVPTDGTFAQPNGQVTGMLFSNPDLDPETGDVTTVGILWQPSFADGLNLEVDYWKYKIKEVITQLDPTFMQAQCLDNGSYCDQVIRYATGPNQGQILEFKQPTVNLGDLETNGLDFGVRYALRSEAAGNFNFQVDWTHIDSYKTGAIEVVGTFNRQFGNFAKDRATASIGWNKAGFDAQVAARYIAAEELLLPDSGRAVPPEENPPLPIPSVTYVDLYLGYTVNDSLRFSLSGTNITDKQPPILYQNNVTNANTDVVTYDTIGRRFSVSATYKF